MSSETLNIDKHYGLHSLGDCLVMVRWNRAGQEAAMWAMMQDPEKARVSLRKVIC